MNVSKSQIRVRYAETDQMGVAYHGSLIPWFEVGRTDWLRHHVMCYADMEKEYGIHLAVVEVSLQYRKRIEYDDVIDVQAKITELGLSRLRFDYVLERNGVMVATGHSTHVCVNGQGKPVKWPEKVHEQVKRIIST